MNRILKYELEAFGLTGISLPPATRILSVGIQMDRIFMWVEVNSQFEGHEKNRWFTVRPTGEPYLPQGEEKFVGTVQMHETNTRIGLVFHVFETFPAVHP